MTSVEQAIDQCVVALEITCFEEALHLGEDLVGFAAFHIFHGWNLHATHDLACVALDRFEPVDVAAVNKCDGFTGTSSAAGAADTVHVVFWVVW